MWLKRNRADAGGLHAAARFGYVAAAVQAKTPGADALRLAKDDADRAMQWLHKAVQPGCKDADLDALRVGEDFKALQAELKKKPAAKAETKP